MHTILYADDDENDRFFMQRAFKKAGLVAHLALVADGSEALDYVWGRSPFSDRAAHPSPHLVLLDLKMPNITGMEALKALRAHPVSAQLPIIILTSSRQENDVAEALALKANGYLVKPSNAEQLQYLVRHFPDICTSGRAASLRFQNGPGKDILFLR
jgi:CheY-like chemotaxis protein